MLIPDNDYGYTFQFSFLLPPRSPFIEALWPMPDYYKTHPDKEPPRYIFPIPVGKKLTQGCATLRPGLT